MLLLFQRLYSICFCQIDSNDKDYEESLLQKCHHDDAEDETEDDNIQYPYQNTRCYEPPFVVNECI